MSVPRLLALTAQHPGHPGTGGILTADVLRHYPQNRVASYAFHPFGPMNDEFQWLPSAMGKGMPERGISRSPTRAVRIATLPLRYLAWQRQVRRLVRDAVRLGREHRVEMVWATVDFSTNMLFTRRVAEGLGVPLVVCVWDPPEYYMHRDGVDRPLRKWVMREFGRMLRMAQACGTASPEMAEAYQGRYGVRCVPMRHGLPRRVWRAPKAAPSSPDRLTIAVAGSIYAKREFTALLEALHGCSWRVAGRDVTVRVLGGQVELKLSFPVRLEYLGRLPYDQTTAAVNECDIGYVPYWFDPAYREAVQMSFPGKITACLSAGVPILFHGPVDSTPANFLKQYPAGVCCHSLEPDAIIGSLEGFLAEPQQYGAATAVGREVVEQALNLRQYVRAFAELAGIDPDELGAPE